MGLAKSRSRTLLLILAGLTLSSGAAAQEAASYDFVGVGKCKICHSKASSGNQFHLWSESAHSKAYETLAGEKAREEGAKRGIANPQEAPECLRCHITAFPVIEDIANQKITLEEGISCESCHGPGSAYFKKQTMQAITDGEVDPASVGLTMPTSETCTRCHNTDSPFYKEFDFETFKAKIAHYRPEGGSDDGATTD